MAEKRNKWLFDLSVCLPTYATYVDATCVPRWIALNPTLLAFVEGKEAYYDC